MELIQVDVVAPQSSQAGIALGGEASGSAVARQPLLARQQVADLEAGLRADHQIRRGDS
jgi:hypothetical protein